MKRKTIHLRRPPLAVDRMPQRPKRREGANGPFYVLALKDGPETLGYYVSDDEAVVKTLDQAGKFHDKGLAEAAANTATLSWELPPGQLFVCITC